MVGKLAKSLQMRQKPWQFLIITLLLIGILFRFYNLDTKTYWHDEVHTSMRVSGYNDEDVVKQAFQGQIISPQDLLKFQKTPPEHSLKDTWKRLVEHPEHPPLYYILSRIWQDLFGSSVTASRSLAGIFGVLVFPSIYWLCWELFHSKTVCWTAAALTAISPFHVLYAQEAREYSLWTVTVLLASTVLIRAVNSRRIQWWLLYTVCLALSLYVSLLSVFLAVAHAIYIIVIEKLRPNKTTISFALSGIVTIFLFSPWLKVIREQSSAFHNNTYWTNISPPFIELLSAWELNLNTIFIDLHPTINLFLAPRLTAIILFFVGYTLFFIYRSCPLKIWFFMLTLILIPAASLMLPDLIIGGRKSIAMRYYCPSIVGIEVAVAFWLVNAKLTCNKLCWSVFCLIATAGICSLIISSQAPTWWNKVLSYDIPEIASKINRLDKPLVISNNHDINIGNSISLGYLLNPQVKLLFTEKPDVPEIPAGDFSEVLVWNISDSLLEEFKQKNNCNLELVDSNSYPDSDYYPVLWLVKENLTD